MNGLAERRIPLLQTPIRQSQSLNQHRVITIVLHHARQRGNFLLQVFVLS